MAAKTWTGEWWMHGGGGNAWHGFTYDAELDQLYIGTGNGSPWNRKIRSPERRRQPVPLLDRRARSRHRRRTAGTTRRRPARRGTSIRTWTSCSPTCRSTGRPRKVILHAPKNGFFYVIDRTNGKLISAEPFTHDDVGDAGSTRKPAGRSKSKARATSAASRRSRRRRSARTTGTRCRSTRRPASRITRRCTSPPTFNDKGIDPKTWRCHAVVGRLRRRRTVHQRRVAAGHERSSSLQAWDPVRQQLAWEVPMDGVFNPGTMTTAGNLVFQGRVDGSLRAYTADTGKEVWRRDLGPRHLGAADHVRGERQAVRRDSRRMGRRHGRPRRPALRGARLGVRRAQALPRRVRARRQGDAPAAAATGVAHAAESRLHGRIRRWRRPVRQSIGALRRLSRPRRDRRPAWRPTCARRSSSRRPSSSRESCATARARRAACRRTRTSPIGS